MSAGDALALAVDLGTGGPKVGLVTLGGELVSFEHLRVETTFTSDGGAEQDASAWWELISGAARRALTADRQRAARVTAVAVTGQWASRVPVDEHGRPVGPCVMWMDTRGARHSRDLVGGRAAGFNPRRAAQWIRRSGGVPSPAGADPISHILHLERDRPEVAAAARWFLEPVDYLTMRFTGRATATPASMLAAWLTDNRDLGRPPAYDDVLVRLARIDPAKLPPLERTGTVIGEVPDELADSLGLPHGVEVITGVPDLHAATIGSGAVGLSDAHLSVSTTGWISCPFPRKKTDALHSMASVPGVGDGRYVVANSIDSAGVSLEWARRVLGRDAEPFAELLADAERAPSGSNGVVFAPWLGGTRSPVEDRAVRGSWEHVSLRTTQADLLRSVLEGVALHGRWLHAATEGFAGRRLEPLRIIGGGAQSDLWCQIHADVLGRRVERVVDPASAILRGAGLLAGIALGAVERNALRGLVAVDAIFDPDPVATAIHDRTYRALAPLHKAQRRLARRLAR